MRHSAILLSLMAIVGVSVFSLQTALASDTQPKGASLLPEAPHGGTLKEATRMNLELVTKGNEIKLYPLSKMRTPVKAEMVQLTAVARPVASKDNKAQTGETVALKPAGDHYVASIDNKRLGPYELKVEARAKGEKEEYVFLVEKMTEKK